MLCPVIKLQDPEKLYKTLPKLPFSLFEIRLDALSTILSYQTPLLNLFQSLPDKRFILTIRSKEEGGCFKGSLQEQMAFYQPFFFLENLILDIEINKAFSWLLPKNKKASIVFSYHGSLQKLPDTSLISQNNPHAYFKYCLDFSSSLQALSFAQDFASKKCVVLSSNPQHAFLRFMFRHFNMPWMYTTLQEKHPFSKALIPYSVYKKEFHLSTVHAHTPFFALIGEPVNYSNSHFTHNYFFHKKQLDFRYVKIPVKPEELEAFLTFCQFNPHFKGFSVTMPLKEKAARFLGEQALPSINTLILKPQYMGFNTDASAIYKVLKENDIKAPGSIAIVGRGGVAKCVAHDLNERGYSVTVYTRGGPSTYFDTLGVRVKALQDLGGELEKAYIKALVQATPVGMKGYPFKKLPIKAKQLKAPLLVIDMVGNPRFTALIKLAKKQGCSCVSGKKVFFLQALEQWECYQQHIPSNLTRI